MDKDRLDVEISFFVDDALMSSKVKNRIVYFRKDGSMYINWLNGRKLPVEKVVRDNRPVVFAAKFHITSVKVVTGAELLRRLGDES